MGDQPAFSHTSRTLAEQGRDPARREADILERLWGICSCDRCGETIILDEQVFRVEWDGQRESVCFACAAEPRHGHMEASLHDLRDLRVETLPEERDAA